MLKVIRERKENVKSYLYAWYMNKENADNTKEISLIANFEVIDNIVNYFLNGGDLLVNSIKLIHKLNYKNELKKN